VLDLFAMKSARPQPQCLTFVIACLLVASCKNNAPPASSKKKLACKNILKSTSKVPCAELLKFKIVDDSSAKFTKVATLLVGLQDPEFRVKLPADVTRVFMENPAGKSWRWRPVYRNLAKVKAIVGDVVTRGGHKRYDIYLQFPTSIKPTVNDFFRKLNATPALAAYKIPGEREVAYGPPDRPSSESTTKVLRTYYLHREPVVTGEYLEDAGVGYDDSGQAIVTIRFGKTGEKKFRKLTKSNVGRQLAIILGGVVQVAPEIQSEIGARCQIMLGGNLSALERQQEAEKVACYLKACFGR